LVHSAVAVTFWSTDTLYFDGGIAVYGCGDGIARGRTMAGSIARILAVAGGGVNAPDIAGLFQAGARDVVAGGKPS
jgi:hypothetical protein